jgi:hypothetical protein
MLALRRHFRQVVVTNEKFNGPNMISELLGRLLLDSRVVDLPRSSNLIVVILSSSKPLFFNGLKKASHFSGRVGA